MDLIQCDRIYVCRADILEDKYEGHYTRQIYDIARGISIIQKGNADNTEIIKKREKWRKMTYINCWTRSCSDNVALWKIYGGTKNSVAIETTEECLERELRDGSIDGNWEIVSNGNRDSLPLSKSFDLSKLTLHDVKYIDYNSPSNELATKLLLSAPEIPFTHKHKAFSHEEEVRIICQPCPTLFIPPSPHVPGDLQIINGRDYLLHHLNDCPEHFDSCPNNTVRFPKGLTIRVDSRKLIDKVWVGPYAEKWFYNLLTEVLKKFEFAQDIIEWSGLRTPPHKRTTT
jgi:hypothetical protein